MHVRIEPCVRNGFLKIIDNKPVIVNLCNAGLNFSYYVGF